MGTPQMMNAWKKTVHKRPKSLQASPTDFNNLENHNIKRREAEKQPNQGCTTEHQYIIRFRTAAQQ